MSAIGTKRTCGLTGKTSANDHSGHQDAARENMMAEARTDFEGPTPRLCSRAFAPSDIGL